MSLNELRVRTHVGRDLLQNSQHFHSDMKVIWEYVANGIQYRQAGVPPVVSVEIHSAARKIVITDNGQGMDQHGLANFFIMHGENQDRKAGRIGRGRFGTGKSAAFGIADALRVSSVRDGLRNTVELNRNMIEAAGDGDIPVKRREVDVQTRDRNGTTITISGIHLRRFDVPGIIRNIEQQIARLRNQATIYVDDHECQYLEPLIQEKFDVSPPDEVARVIGHGLLTLKVSKSPLPVELRGVAVYANGNWLSTTLAGAEGQSMSDWIFGEIDVPALDDDSAPIPAFDVSRAMRLNPNNEVVSVLLPFIGQHVDQLRKRLVKADKERKEQDEAKRLESEAKRIAEAIASRGS